MTTPLAPMAPMTSTPLMTSTVAVVAAERVGVVAEARSWIGTPFHHAACIKGTGVDCAQLLVGVYGALGLVARPAIADYTADWFLHQDRERILEVIADHCLDIAAPEIGDIALFRFGRTVSHAAIVAQLNPMTVVHSYRGIGVIEEKVGPMTPLGTRAAGYWTLRRWMRS